MDSATSTEFLSTREEGDAHSATRKDRAGNHPHSIPSVKDSMGSAIATEFLSTREEGNAHSIVVKGGTAPPEKTERTMLRTSSIP